MTALICPAFPSFCGTRRFSQVTFNGFIRDCYCIIESQYLFVVWHGFLSASAFTRSSLPLVSWGTVVDETHFWTSNSRFNSEPHTLSLGCHQTAAVFDWQSRLPWSPAGNRKSKRKIACKSRFSMILSISCKTPKN